MTSPLVITLEDTLDELEATGKELAAAPDDTIVFEVVTRLAMFARLAHGKCVERMADEPEFEELAHQLFVLTAYLARAVLGWPANDVVAVRRSAAIIGAIVVVNGLRNGRRLSVGDVAAAQPAPRIH